MDTESEKSSSSHPSEKYLKAKDRIEKYEGMEDYPLDVLLSSWSRDDKVDFAKWYSDDRQKQREKDIKAQRARTAMIMAQYIGQLKGVDFRDTKSIFSFVQQTQIRDWDPYPDPIILGSELGNESGVIYQLRSQLVHDCEPTSDLGEETAPSDAFDEIRDKKYGARYAFFLGVLVASLPPSKNSCDSGFSSSSIEPATAPRRIVQTPYGVYVLPVDRSIWLVLPGSSLSLSTDDLSRGIPQDADTWSYLQTKANGRSPFDLVQVAT